MTNQNIDGIKWTFYSINDAGNAMQQFEKVFHFHYKEEYDAFVVEFDAKEHRTILTEIKQYSGKRKYALML